MYYDFPDKLLKDLPSTFYRVSVKAIVFDDQQRLLIYENDKSNWEMPGGGLEFEESIEDCLKRELQEEVGLTVTTIEPIKFVYSYRSGSGYHKVCLAVPVMVNPSEVSEAKEPSLRKAWYVSREQAMKHVFQPGEVGTKRCIEQIWA